ncbi:hypothetical protein B0H14DRAFT_2245019, partial [Mycena olivaceomarginata]
PPPCPANAPDWFINARNELTRENLGPHFHAALEAWTRLEAACKFESPSHKLSATNRPEEIFKWINGARGLKQRAPTVEDPERFARQWWSWWDLLQPEWRVRDAEG